MCDVVDCVDVVVVVGNGCVEVVVDVVSDVDDHVVVNVRVDVC